MDVFQVQVMLINILFYQVSDIGPFDHLVYYPNIRATTFSHEMEYLLFIIHNTIEGGCMFLHNFASIR